MEIVATLFDIGESPDDVSIRQIGDGVHIYVRKIDKEEIYRHVATIRGVHKKITTEKNYPGRYTDIVVDYGEDKEKREVVATLLHKRNLATIEEIEATRPVCVNCGIRTELIGGSVFMYFYRCSKCGSEIHEY